MPRIIRPKTSLWLPPSPLVCEVERHHPWHGPSRSWRGLGRRCCCGGVPCEHCDNGQGPEQWEVVLTGLVSNDPVGICTTAACLSLNDTFILDNTFSTDPGCEFHPEVCTLPGGTGIDPCLWQFAIPSTEWDPCDIGYSVCSLNYIALELTATDIRVVLYTCGPFSTHITYKATRSEIPLLECLSVDGLDLPFDSQQGPLGNVHCDAAGSTCTITALVA